MRRETSRRIAALVCIMLLAASHLAGAQALGDLTLEELMRIDAGRVFGASERSQPVTEAPASVSFITADEIARYGYRTLADILRGVRGMYVTDDRNFSLIGVRGFATPGDYNSRILLLVNGHRMNDNVFGQAEIGAEFGLDPAMFERVEVIRGPAASIYGDSAFFAVVNVITKPGAAIGGASVTLEAGTLGTLLTRAAGGQRFANGVDLILSATYAKSTGVQRLYFPVYDTPQSNNGIADGLDGERLSQFFGQLMVKDFTITGAYGRRERMVPTASFGVRFNEQVSREQTTDRHLLADVEYGHTFGANRLTVRGAFDQFSYDGVYPNELGTDDGAIIVGLDHVLGSRWTASTRLTRPLPGRQVLTLGAEFIDNIHLNQTGRFVDPPTLLFALNRSSLQQAAFVQDEVRLASWLIANGGLRYDRYQNFDRVTPRAALIAMPSSNQSFKYLYGRAFRAPNLFETNSFYFGSSTQGLFPESIDTHEVVWERYTSDRLRTAVSLYRYDADGLITQVLDPTTFVGTTFVNQGHVQARGLEVEAQMRLGAGVQGVMSYALQRAENADTGQTLVNSPAQMAKVRLSVAGPWKGAITSTEVLTMSSRRTLAGNTLGAATTASVTLLAPIRRGLDLEATARNLFNAQYSDPGSDSHRQDDIPQNGRTFRIGVRWTLWAKD
jgi:outer membrane receptor for ferrienterochelin and colicins